MQIIKGNANTESSIKASVSTKPSGTVTIELVSGGFRSHEPGDHRISDKNWIKQMAEHQNTKQMVIW